MARAAAEATHLHTPRCTAGRRGGTRHVCRCRCSVLSVSSLFFRILICMDSAAAPDGGHVGLSYIPPLLFLMIMCFRVEFFSSSRVCVYVCEAAGPDYGHVGTMHVLVPGRSGPTMLHYPAAVAGAALKAQVDGADIMGGLGPAPQVRMPWSCITSWCPHVTSRHGMSCHVSTRRYRRRARPRAAGAKKTPTSERR